MKKFLAAILAVSIVFGAGTIVPDSADHKSMQACASSEYTEGTYEFLKYKNYGDYIEISYCSILAEEVVIPSELDGVPVTVIGDSSFWNCKSLTSVIIPDSVVSIDNGVFWGCENMAYVIVPESVANIGNSAFEAFKGTIYGFAGSTAQEFAEKKGYKFSILTLGDVDGDGAKNSSDASLVLREYALIATGEAPTFSESQKISADVNFDGAVDSSDASVILAYYAYTSTGGTENINNFMKK